jgi:enoyl-CoA hydratase
MTEPDWAGEERRDGDGYFVETSGHVRRVTMHRPDSMNALSPTLQSGLIEEFLLFGEDPELRVLVLTASGTRAFCPGFDLKQAGARDQANQRFRGPMKQAQRLLFEVIGETQKPTIAALNGVAIGAGLEMALACDLRLAAEGARVGLPEARIGMGAVYGSVVLPRHIPLGIALEMMYTGDYITAEQAAVWGLVNHVYAADQLAAAAMTLAARIAANAPITVRRMKEMAFKGLTLPISAALRLDVGPDPYGAQDRIEGIRAFLEKRPPQWTGR